MKLILIAALNLPTFALAAPRPPVYRQAPPEHVCVSATSIEAKAGSCDDNKTFLKNAQDCWDSVKLIHEQVTKEFKSRISGGATGGQDKDFGTSKADQEEAVAAHDYMLKVTETALADLDKYFDYVVLPDDLAELSDDEVLAVPCYHDAVFPMDAISEQMEDKIDEMKESKGLEITMGKTSGSRATNTGSLSGKQVKGGKGQGGVKDAPPAGTDSTVPSTITGTEEDKKKREQQQQQ